MVLTKYGYLMGFPDKEDTLAWKGIPYAPPPVGERRWRAPAEPEPWNGIKRAKRFGNPAPQSLPLLGGVSGSEDCLYLNIWRPSDPETNLPVYVWIHGGGNTLGSANMVPDYYGHAQAARARVVFVSINYRLGPFGWMLNPDLGEGQSPEDASGNYGTLDILESLKWIKNNITAFGGDPERVILAGESAGAMNILSLLLSPLSKDLFHGAIIQSGVPRIVKAEEAVKRSNSLMIDLMLRERGIDTAEEAKAILEAKSPEERAAWLRSKGQREIMSLLKGNAMGMSDWPSIIADGYVLPKEGYELFESGNYPVKVPIIIGSNKEEIKIFLFFDKSLDYKGEIYRLTAEYGSRSWKAEGVDSPAEKLSSHPDQPPVYVYRFDWGAVNSDGESPLPKDWGIRLGAFHSLEIPFFLGTDTINGLFLTGRLFTRKNREGRENLSLLIGKYLKSFAYTGNPNPEDDPSLPKWVPRKSGEAAGLIFDGSETTLVIKPLSHIETPEDLKKEIFKTLEEPLLSQVLERLLWSLE